MGKSVAKIGKTILSRKTGIPYRIDYKAVTSKGTVAPQMLNSSRLALGAIRGPFRGSFRQ
jgi:hypothetical protein